MWPAATLVLGTTITGGMWRTIVTITPDQRLVLWIGGMGRAHDEAERLINTGASRAGVIVGLQEFEGRAAFRRVADEQEVRDDVRRLLHYMRGHGLPDGATDRDREIFARIDAA